MRRGGEQKSVVVLSQQPYSSVLAPLSQYAGPLYFNEGPEALQLVRSTSPSRVPAELCYSGTSHQCSTSNALLGDWEANATEIRGSESMGLGGPLPARPLAACWPPLSAVSRLIY